MPKDSSFIFICFVLVRSKPEKVSLGCCRRPAPPWNSPELLTIANLTSNGIDVTLMPEDMILLLTTDNIRVIDIKNQKAYNSISVIWNDNGNLPLVTQYALDVSEDFRENDTLQSH